MKTKSLGLLFWERVSIGDGCWNWKGCLTTCKMKYGRLKHNLKTYTAHRLSWTLNRGDTGNLQVLHHCDNPQCVRPDHLFLGTHKDNMTDRDSKNRQACGDRCGARLHPESLARGIKSGMAKLDDNKVIEIRKLSSSGVGKKKIGIMFGVSKPTITAVVRRETWSHVP